MVGFFNGLNIFIYLRIVLSAQSTYSLICFISLPSLAKFIRRNFSLLVTTHPPLIIFPSLFVVVYTGVPAHRPFIHISFPIAICYCVFSTWPNNPIHCGWGLFTNTINRMCAFYRRRPSTIIYGECRFFPLCYRMAK